MKKNNNKGSALVTVIVLFCVLMTIGTVTMTYMGNNHRKRVKESRRLENLYESESGLDVAYNIIIKTFEAGINAGTERVKNINQEELEKLSQKEKSEMVNKEFKLGFKSLIGISNTDNEFKKSIDGTKYIYNYNAVDDDNKYKNIKYNLNKKDRKPTVTTKNVIYKNDKYKIQVSSQFETNDSTGKNKRELEVEYDVEIPDYQDVNISVSDKTIQIPREFKNKVIAIDGDMITDGNDNVFDINGDVFVKGNDNKIDNLVYDKYKGGIKFSGVSSAVNLNGDVVTSKTFNVDGDSININQKYPEKFNLYAGNMYVGKTTGKHSSNILLNINNTVLDNDLAIKSDASTINIKNFYGINDKTYNMNRDGQKESRTSSSIIVNGNNASSLNISNEAYIMGTAYINAQNENNQSYQTGESVGVRGNYVAYTYPLGEINNLEFGNYGSMQLVDSVNGMDLTSIQKSEYFKEFIELNKKNNLGANLNHGGVTLPQKTYSVGAVVKNVNNNLVVERSNYNKEMDNFINEKRSNYAKEVYCMGNNNDKNLESIYNSLGTYQETVASKINLVDKDYNSPEEKEYKLVINSDKNKTIKLGKDIKPIDGKIKALIITNGNVKLEGNFEFEGAIISTKDVNIYNKHKDINYNEETIKTIVSLYSDKLKGVFLNEETNIAKNLDDKNTETNESYIYQYDVKKYIRTKLWKIIR